MAAEAGCDSPRIRSQAAPADLIEAAIGRAKSRRDLKSRAAYIVCYVRDGGYDDDQMLRSESGGGTSQTVSDAPRTYSSAEQTRAEMLAMEAENATKQQQFNETMKSLQARCAELSQTLKNQLKECCERAIDSLVPQTSGREAQLENSSYKKLAFKNVMGAVLRVDGPGHEARRCCSLVGNSLI